MVTPRLNISITTTHRYPLTDLKYPETRPSQLFAQISY